jgi:hypothetical protein
MSPICRSPLSKHIKHCSDARRICWRGKLYSANNEAAANAKGVKRACLPDRSAKKASNANARRKRPRIIAAASLKLLRACRPSRVSLDPVPPYDRRIGGKVG